MVRRCFPLCRLASSFTLLILLLAHPAGLFAQDRQDSSPLADVIKGVVFDPTTYAPALVSYHATMRDWETSQPFFRQGYVERNRRFTVSGRPNDAPIGFEAGRNLILRDTLTTLGVSAVQNATSRLVERALLERYPEQRTLVKTLGWVQRIAVGSFMTYHLSAAHYRQAALNARLARELGYR